MSDRVEGSHHTDTQGGPFGGDGVPPLERRRRAHQFLTQETRYYVIQATLGHPSHLVTLDEFDYLVPKNRSTIHEHLTRLADKDVMDRYTYEGDSAPGNDPREFWGFTASGVTLLDEYNYLRYVPVLRALQDALYLTDKIERHREAPRPDLPPAVATAFTPPEPDADTERAIESALAARDSGSERLFDAPPRVPDSDRDSDIDGDSERPIDELF